MTIPGAAISDIGIGGGRRYSRWSMIERMGTRLRDVAAAGLAMLAIIGVLVMHGVGPTTIDGGRVPHHAHTDHDTGDRLGVVLDLCTFMIVGIGLAATVFATHGHHIRRWPSLISRVSTIGWTPPAGRLRLLELCVVRV